jgi:hypothetical protein
LTDANGVLTDTPLAKADPHHMIAGSIANSSSDALA